MIFNKFLPLICLILLNQGAFILAQVEVTLCDVANPSPDNLCTMEYMPVCAYRYVCVGGLNCDQGVTVGNACGACCQEGYDFYTEGACEGDEEGIIGEEQETEDGVIWCQPIDSEVETVCTLEYAPVCAYNAGEEDSSGVTVGNACQACYQQGFDYYTQGVCDDDIPEEETFSLNGNDIIYCDDQSFPPGVSCTQEYVPVCAFGREGGQDGTNIGNACQACFQLGYEYYYEGECLT